MSLSILQFTQLLTVAFSLAAGNVLFKFVALNAPKIHDAAGIFRLFANPLLWVAGLVYFGATLLWIFILQQVPLSRAYPFVALGFVMIPCVSFFVFGESITPRLVVGSLFILVGIYFAGVTPS